MTIGPHPDLVSEVRAALVAEADAERAAGQQRYMKSAMPYFGLTSPQLKAALTPLLRDPGLAMESREQWEATIRALWDGATHREQWYAAIALARHRPYRAWVDSDAMPLWESLIRAGRGGTSSTTSRRTSCATRCSPTRRWRGCGCATGPARTRCGCAERRSSARSARVTASTSRSSPTSSSPTSTTRTSSAARRSAGRCVTTPASTRSGCARSSPPTPTCPASRDARRSSTSGRSS